MSATGKVEAQRGDGWTPIQPGRQAHALGRRAHVGGIRRRAAPRRRDGDRAASRVEIRLDSWTAGGPAAGRRRRRPRGCRRPAASGVSPAAKAAPSVDLRRGKVLARVGNTGALSIHARDTRTTSEGPARFVVLADEQGRVAVATLAGKDDASRPAARPSRCRRGRRRASQGGAPPDDPEHISEEVFLNVVWPTVDRHGERAGDQGPRHAVVGGDRARAQRLETATVGADGQFTVTVPREHRQDADRGRGGGSRGPHQQAASDAARAARRRPRR